MIWLVEVVGKVYWAARGPWYTFEPETAAEDGWADATGKERFEKSCKNRFDASMMGKAKSIRQIGWKVVNQGL